MIEEVALGSHSSRSRLAPSGEVRYFTSYAIDFAGHFKPAGIPRYEVVNEVALPSTAKLAASLCFNCGDTGHAVRACPQPYDGR
jgi:hypothetical protein